MADTKTEILSSDPTGGMVANSTPPATNGKNNLSTSTKKFKGVKVCCGDLRKYLYGVDTYRQASMLRKGREVHKIYVDVHKGVSFLDDRFSLTEFGKMVLENGSIRAGRARNVPQIVVARETLYCSGTGGCKRACGGYGACVSGCDKIKVRGHKCSFRVKLTMRLGFVDCWFVEILGSHNCYIDDGEAPNDVSKMAADYENKSSDGEDSNLSSSQRVSPASDTPGPLISVGQNGTSFLRPDTVGGGGLQLPPPPSPSAAMLMTSAHCPLNIPMFPESYLMTVARNAAAAAAMSSSNHHHPRDQMSPLSLTGLKRERSPPDVIVPEIMNGYLPPAIIPPFGLLPTASTPTPPPGLGENGHHPHHRAMSTPPLDAMDLSTPKLTQAEDAPRDLSMHTVIKSSPPTSHSTPTGHPSRQSPKIHLSNGHDLGRGPGSALLNGFGTSNNNNNKFGKASGGSTMRTKSRYSANGRTNSSSPHSPHSPTQPAAVSLSLKLSPTSFVSEPDTSLHHRSPLSSSPNPAFSSSTSTLLPSSSSVKPGCAAGGSMGLQTNNRSRKNPSRCLRPYQSVHASVLFHREPQPRQDGRSLEEEEIKLEPMKTPPADEEEDEEEEDDGDDEDTEEVDKDLRNRVQQLEAHVVQLRNIVLKADGSKAEGRRKAQREFDFTKYNTRHVALKVAYLGWDYHGFVVQEDSDKTVEAALFEALIKTRLIESRETSNYHRCGRTDKGVSALGQVISIDLRTNLLKGVGVKVREGGTAESREGDKTTEVRYVHILNKVLPPEIRVLAWAPVDPGFSARFSCKKRTYKYYFPKGNLNIQKMSEAAVKLVGEHDFRNFCKMDVGNGVVNFTRKILKAEVAVLDEIENGFSMCELTVVGQAFLWHQIRCIVSVLFLVAQGKESLEIVEELLNVEKNPRKPQYTMASELPLVLFDCDFGDDLEWVYEADWHEDNIRHLQQMWAQHSVRATMLKRMLKELDVAKVETESDIAPWNELSAPLLQQSEWLIPGNKPRVHKPLFKRQLCESLEQRIEYYAKRRKLNETETAAAGEDESSASKPTS
ncbi:uncharacterized protein LOC101858380 [Aplysia californica]|uniref:Uncharacterized protein LOC101858380 n=1 Tax=Aplysia californica TaxID=6500 RepID=A0ABM1AEC2_APLCA|nr:uncharacterized protein LOC101858380 [Aplysia californica]